ncbi:MAG TPA: PAS domain-containing protein, partial [Verrucomicrobiae bacterium]|nr:PAS domain-containing protein [Verrucomicrobiae bacterium]
MCPAAPRRPEDSPPVDRRHPTQSLDVLTRIFEFAPDATLLLDADGRMLEVNLQAMHLFGYDRAELVGEPVEKLLPKRFVGRHVEYRSGSMGEPRTRPTGAGVELFALRRNGSEVPVDIMLSTLDTDQG